MTGTPRLWRDGHREAAQELIDWLLATKLPNGWPVGPDFDVPLIEFAESATPKLSRTEAWRLLDLLSKAGEKSLDDFERLWNAGQGAENAEREWQFWLPLGLSLPHAETALAFTLLGTRFAVEPSSAVLSSLADDLKKQPEFRYYERDHAMPTMFVTFAARGEGWRGAWQVAGGAWDAFRGLAEFAFGRGQLRLLGEGPRARILHPSWLLARAPGEVIQCGQFSFDYEPERLPTGDFRVTQAKVDHFQKLAEPLKEDPPKGSTLS
ncbi:MAG TPA: hypothetical protein VK754_07600, partial [Propionibacteriaceae bacterium]|nr:hypothetical protein [Propionibacteriaceae bacterium]